MSAVQSPSVHLPAFQARSVYHQGLLQGKSEGVTCSSIREEKWVASGALPAAAQVYSEQDSWGQLKGKGPFQGSTPRTPKG